MSPQRRGALQRGFMHLHESLDGIISQMVGGPSDADLQAAAAKLVVFGFDGPDINDHARRMIRKGCGGVILFGRNVKDPEQVAQLCNDLKRAAEPRPLLVMVDQEGGKVARLGAPFTKLPAARDITAAADPSAAAAAVGKVAGRELRAVGIDMNLAPVMDVDTNPDNPVIGSRSFSREPATVSAMGAAYITALQSQGVAACAKHFPGHGDTSIDSHLELPTLPHNRERLDAVELPPFQAAVDAEAAAVLVAHVAVPALADDREPGSQPATMSAGALRVLRHELGYGGLVLSDDMEMGAITKHYGLDQAVVEGLAAGVDLFLVCHTESKQEAAMGAMIDAVRSGALPYAKLQAAGRRYDHLAAMFVRPPTGMPAAAANGGGASGGAVRITLIGCQEHRQMVADILRNMK